MKKIIITTVQSDGTDGYTLPKKFCQSFEKENSIEIA